MQPHNCCNLQQSITSQRVALRNETHGQSPNGKRKSSVVQIRNCSGLLLPACIKFTLRWSNKYVAQWFVNETKCYMYCRLSLLIVYMPCDKHFISIYPYLLSCRLLSLAYPGLSSCTRCRFTKAKKKQNKTTDDFQFPESPNVANDSGGKSFRLLTAVSPHRQILHPLRSFSQAGSKHCNSCWMNPQNINWKQKQHARTCSESNDYVGVTRCTWVLRWQTKR